MINRSLQSGKVQRKRTGSEDIRGLYHIIILDYIIYNNEEDNRQGVGGYREEKDNRIIEKRKGEERKIGYHRGSRAEGSIGIQRREKREEGYLSDYRVARVQE